MYWVKETLFFQERRYKSFYGYEIFSYTTKQAHISYEAKPRGLNFVQFVLFVVIGTFGAIETFVAIGTLVANGAFVEIGT